MARKRKRKPKYGKPLAAVALLIAVSALFAFLPRDRGERAFLRRYLTNLHERYGDKGGVEKVEAIECSPAAKEDPSAANRVECRAEIRFQRGTASLKATLSQAPEDKSGWRVHRLNLVPEGK